MRTSLFSLLAAVLFLLSVPAVAQACSVCFGNPDHPQTQGVQKAIVFLLAVIGGVLAALATFFIHLVRRSRLAARTATTTNGRLAGVGDPANNNGRSYR